MTSQAPDTHAKEDVLAALLICGVVLAAKATTFATPYYWDEVLWAEAALWLSDGSLVRALPGLHPPVTFSGHPAGLHFLLATLFKLFGRSIGVAHGLIAAFSMLGLFFTFKVGRFLYGPLAGLLAAMFLFAIPVYFAQSGMFLGDVPVAALGTASAYFALRRRPVAYVVCAAFLVLVKETAIAIVAAIALYTLMTTEGSVRVRLRATAVYATPLLVIATFFLVQRLATGHAFFIYDHPIAFFEVGLGGLANRIAAITRWLFVDQSRSLLVALLILAVCFDGSSRWRREYLLFTLITLLGAYPFAVIYYLPRYVLPVFPFLCVAAAGALTRVVPTLLAPAQRALALGLTLFIAVLIAAVMHASPAIKADSNHEWNQKYVDVVRVQRAAYAFIEQQRTQASKPVCVLTLWPHTRQLAYPELGYVASPMSVSNFQGGKGAVNACELLLWSDPGHGRSGALRSYALAHGYTLTKRVEDGPIVAEVYQRAAAGSSG